MDSIVVVKRVLPVFLFLAAFLAVQGCGGGGGSGKVEVAKSLNDKGVSWGFGEEALTGTFANGDPWVVGPVTIVSITPSFTGNRNGWEVNPSSTVNQGFDSRVMDFNPGLVPSLPYGASPNQSLVKTVSVAGNCIDTCLQRVSVLTVLAAAPPDNGATIFRPSYFGNNKTLHSIYDLQLNLLPNLAPTPSAPSFTQVANNYSNVQLDHKANWTGRAIHPIESMPDYGAAIAVRNASSALALMMQGSDAEKGQAVINYVNYGLDVYYQHRGGLRWFSEGGHGEGRKLPAVMAAVLLNDASMQTYLASASRDGFGETDGARFSATANTSLWGQWSDEDLYWQGLMDGSNRFYEDPYGWIDGADLSSGIVGNYQYCCTTKPWEAIVAAVRLMPALGTAMNADDLDIYVERWRSRGFHTQPDPCAPVIPGGVYGVDFGPDGSGGCILDSDPWDGTGRFPSMHGQYAAEGFYESQFSDELWAAYNL